MSECKYQHPKKIKGQIWKLYPGTDQECHGDAKKMTTDAGVTDTDRKRTKETIKKWKK